MSLARELTGTRTWVVNSRDHAHEVLAELAHVAKQENEVGVLVAVDVSMEDCGDWYGTIVLDGYPLREQG